VRLLAELCELLDRERVDDFFCAFDSPPELEVRERVFLDESVVIGLPQ
jgi:hypothetical protein